MVDKPSTVRRKPINPIPFEAFHDGSWHSTESIRIRDGFLFCPFELYGSATESKINSGNLRIKSRKATTFDCWRRLKPGMDVCVLSAQPTEETSGDELQNPLLSWCDAKIVSIKRASHIYRCTCLFSVVFYKYKSENPMKNMTLERRTEVITIENIRILQKLRSHDPCEGEYSRWSSSEDCANSNRGKLISGAFSSEVSWLVVLSSLKGMHFDIKLVQDRVVYQVLNGDQESTEYIEVVCFQTCEEKFRPKFERIPEEILQPKIEVFKPESPNETVLLELNPVVNILDSESDVEVLYDSMTLRHSKRRRMEPDRFFSSFSPSTRPSLKKVSNDTKRIEYKMLTGDDSRALVLVEEEEYLYKLECNIAEGHEGNPSEFYFHDHHQQQQEPKENKENSFKRKYFHERGIPSSYNFPFSSSSDRKKWSQKKKLLSETECKRMIERCIGNIEYEMGRESQTIPQWTESQPEERLNFNWSPSNKSQPEVDEHEDLWKEMEHTLFTLTLLEKKQELDSDEGPPCLHDFRLNEEIGLVCQLCNFICTESQYAFPSILRGDGVPWNAYRERVPVDENGWWGRKDWESDHLSKGFSREIAASGDYDNAWALISDLKPKLHLHQKGAFEFIWRNIAGSLRPCEMNHHSENTGGCVISHSPGAGKTLLIISFLISYLKLFPKVRPLILCPKIAVYIWNKEFEKWGFPFPVHQILPYESYKREMWNRKSMPSTGTRKPTKKMMHTMDSFMKLRQWHEHPSVLVMSYSSFLHSAFEDSKIEHRRFMAGLLLKSPGILILDEGHNPRSTRSKLRKLLMRSTTEFRILLSGTLFQNNFEEYFNTLSLARPRFINDVLTRLDPKMGDVVGSKKRKEAKAANREEHLARKFFVEKVGQKIESSLEEDRKQGFELLNRITSPFIDAYEGETSEALPGLQTYTLLLKSTDLQHEVLEKLHHHQIKYKRCPLELELLIALGSIHPWLITTVTCVNDFFAVDELKAIEECKASFSIGSKAKFVIDVVHKSTVRGERVLVFCHNISPINLLTELFSIVFGWTIGKEVLVLKGDQELSERGRIMEAFNRDDGKGRCQVLLASTTACSEGINLVAASRLILLDSEWNHAKTRQAIARAFRPGQERVVYVYRLLASGTWEEDKYNRNTWKSWLSRMIFVGDYFDYCPSRKVEEVDDDILRELVDEDQSKSLQMILEDVRS